MLGNYSEDTKITLDHLCPNQSEEELMLTLSECAEYESPPPTIDQFLDDPYYLRHIGQTIYPFWREKLREVHPSPYYSPYGEIAITGSTGGGKTTFCLVSMLYELCCFLHRKFPHHAFGFTEGQPIYMGLCNATLTLSNDVQLKNFFSMIDNSPFFQEQRTKRSKKNKPAKNAIALNLPHNIELLAGSVSKHLIGRAVLSAMISELNVQTREGGNQAINTYIELKNRLFTRFNRGEFLCPPGKLYLDSSKKEAQGTLEQYIEALKDDPKVLIIEAAYWEFVKGSEKDTFSGKTFAVFRGSPSRDPFVLTGSAEDHNVPESLIIEVPIELKKFFDTDPLNALRDLGGVSTWSTGSFITSVEAINEALVLDNPTSKPVIELDLYDKSDTLMRYIRLETGSLIKDVPYFVHIDLSTSKDRTGIAFTRRSGVTELERFDRLEGSSKLLQDNIYQTDLLICLKSKPSQEIPLYKIENFLVEISKLGYKIAGISFDQFASADLMQRLKQYGFNVEYVSVDRDRKAYDTFRMALLERRWKGSYNPILEKELKELVDKVDKIDHPEQTAINKAEYTRPSKDLADAVAGSVFQCAQKGGVYKGTIALKEFCTAMQAKRRPRQQTMNERVAFLRSQHSYY